MKASEFLAWVDGCVDLMMPSIDPCCKKGCSHCCYEPAYAYGTHIDYIIEGLTPEQIEYVKGQLPEWLERTKPLRLTEERANAFDYRDLNAPCPLLKDGLCIAYERRPMDCRIFFAKGNPDDCRMPARRKQKFAAYSDIQMYWIVRPLIESVRPGDTLDSDHIGAHLARKLLGVDVESAAHTKLEFYG